MKSWRFYLLFIGICVVASGIIARLFFVQVVNHKFYQSQALGQQAGFKEATGSRGEIFFQNSKDARGRAGRQGAEQSTSIAINRTTWNIIAVPKEIEDKQAFAKALEPVLGMPLSQIIEKLEKSDAYVPLKKEVDDKGLAAIKELNLKGMRWEKIVTHYYPQKSFAAHVVGFVGGGGEGQYGIEGYYEDILKGKRGVIEERAGLGIIGADEGNLDGSDLYATIDYNIQFQAEALLAQAHKDFSIDSGQIIVIKPDSGRMVALANFPSFDINAYYLQKDLDIFQNSAVQKLFEPGSVFKPFTMAMALEDGKVSANATFTDTGSVTIGPDTIYNFNREKYGPRDMSGILEKSINTGAVFLQQLVGREKFSRHIDAFGFSQKTGIDVQGEVFSRNEGLKKGSDFGFATASFGQGIQMTPIQLARSFSIFANGGRLPKPFIVDTIVHGVEKQKMQIKMSGQVISEKTAQEVTKMLVNVIERGFGSGARVPGYWLAGKTGTAEVPIPGKKGYYADRTIQSFVGFGPAFKPEFLILVKLDNPKIPKSSLSAAPIFKKLAQYIINYWNIPPDYDPLEKQQN